jgi:hypothetical protein
MAEVGSGDCGVCIGGWDGESGESADFFDSRILKARKAHKCFECGCEIAVGQQYERVSGKWDGELDRFRFCLICSEIGQAFSCEGRLFGCLWENIQEDMFPQMTTGCLEKLTTAAAKQHLVEKWRKWKFDKAA